jgi:peptidyl-prolyl cis-trans isomerase C
MMRQKSPIGKGGKMMKKTLTLLTLPILLISIACAQSPTAKLSQIRKLYLTNDYTKALETLKQDLTEIRDYHTKALYLTEIGDIYLDKLHDLVKAESIYKLIMQDFPKYKDISSIIYRLGISYEKQEKFLDAAQAYEQVATKYMKQPYGDDALDAIERCFKKNYQEVVAKIDEFPITRIEFDDRISQNPSRYEKFEDKQKLLDDMIDERLLYLYAVKMDVDNNPEVVGRLTDLRNNSLFQEWYNQEVIEKVKVSEKEKKGYYRKNKKSQYTTPEQVRAREILVKTKQEAADLRVKIVAESLPFDSVAKDTSLAPNRKTGGDMGYVRKGAQPKPIEKALFRMKVGEISQPIEAKDGFVLLKVEEIKPEEVRTYEKVAQQIENALRNEKTNKLFEKVSKQLKKKYNGFIDTMAIKENKETLGTVDNTPITDQLLQERLARIPPFYRAEFEKPEGKKRILDQIVLEQILLREIEEQKLWLANKFISQFEPRRVSTLTTVLRKMETSDKVTIDTIELKKEYRATINDFKVPEQVRARELVVKSFDEAAKIRKEAIAGKVGFDSLAKQYSTATTKWQGGDMSYFSRGSKPKALETEAFSLSKGKISKVIKLSDTTYAIIKIEDKKKAYTRPFSEVKEKIERSVRLNKEDELYQQMLAGLQSKAKIEKFLTEEPALPEEPEETPQPETPELEEENK